MRCVSISMSFPAPERRAPAKPCRISRTRTVVLEGECRLPETATMEMIGMLGR